jgi:hypothetical protein
MPEPATFAERRQEAIRELEEWLQKALGAAPPRLSEQQIAHYRDRAAYSGWRVPVDICDEVREFDIIVTAAYPFTPPRIALAAPPPFLTWPHVEHDGVLCLTPDHSTFSPDAPVCVLGALLKEGVELVERLRGSEFVDEFKAEIVSYWGQSSNLKSKQILCLIEGSRTQSRIVRFWSGKDFFLIANDDSAITKWLANRFSPSLSVKTATGALIWLNDSLTPDQFPRTGADIYRVASAAGCSHLIDQAAAHNPAEIVTLFSLPTGTDPALVATVVERPKGRGVNVTRGFSKGTVPHNIAGARYFGGQTCFRATVERIDAAWIHGRGKDARFEELRKSKVAVLGCGSVGAPVAAMLAEAGVGHLYLVDKEALAAANVGRHPLGVDALGMPKARALAGFLQKRYPHMSVNDEIATVESLLLSKPNKLEEADLIVSALGSWPAEALLDFWHSSNDAPPAIVYGWTETHAGAGHAVALKGGDIRLRDGISETGVPLLQITQWSDDPNLYAEPACGAFFQPYGPIEVGYVNNMIGELCLDVLLGHAGDATHRIWIARESLVKSAGGKWTPEWERMMRDEHVRAGTIYERRWAREPPQPE